MGVHNNLLVLKGFPFKQSFSLVPLIIYWKRKINSKNQIESEIAKIILDKLDNSYDLLDTIVDKSIVEKNLSFIEGMFTAIISSYRKDQDVYGVATPYLFDFFYASPKMEDIFGEKGRTLHDDLFTDVNKQTNYFGPTLHVYARILKEFYGADTQFTIPVINVRKFDKKLGIMRSYEINIDHSFVNIEPRKKLKKLSDKQIKELTSDFYNLELWFKTLPPEDFELKGFAIVYLPEVTIQQSISLLKDKLLNKDAITSKENFSKLEIGMRSLLKMPELSLGITVFTVDGNNKCGGRNYLNTWRSILPQPEIMPEYFLNSVYEKAVIGADRVFIVKDLENYPNPTKVEVSLLKAGFKSLIIAPLYFDDKLVGVLELASPIKNELNHVSWIEAFKTLPLFSNAAHKVILDLNNEIKAKIQEEYTAIHPIVEWRFIEEVAGQLRKERGAESFEKSPIIFNDVYPLYGAADIRSSSNERNKAILADLNEQLNIIVDILNKAYSLKKLPVFDQVRHEILSKLKILSKGLTSGDEMQIVDFLKEEVKPLFSHIKKNNDDLKNLILDYEGKIDADYGMFNKRRNDFDVSFEMINDSISTIIEKQESIAQKMCPHYFEKYRTDGIEYNIYIGQSLMEEKRIDYIHLKNLRLWQLIVMCKIARSTNKLKSKLPVPMDTTQLILVHSKPLSIKFREDEKKFDVEGGYNIRYEIIKKRIDKALIKGTKDRLTKPGCIAIIYSQQEEFNEYRKFIDYLILKKFLLEKVEDFELEDMQDVYGLRALRVAINLEDNEVENSDNVMNLVKEVVGEVKTH